jgi:transposase
MLPALLADAEQHLTPRIYRLLCLVAEEWRAMEEEIEHLDREIEAVAAHDLACQRLLTVPGIGVLIATATVAAIGNGAAFSRGREFRLAWPDS